jgi:putative redox protein
MVTTDSSDIPYRTTVTNGRVRIQSDAFKDGRGGVEGLCPHELLEAALGACLNVSARLAADALELGPLAVRSAVALDRSVPGRAIFRWRCQVEGALSAPARAAVEEAVRACAVARTLRLAVTLEEDPGLEVAP